LLSWSYEVNNSYTVISTVFRLRIIPRRLNYFLGGESGL
jgi:hypothetical protein